MSNFAVTMKNHKNIRNMSVIAHVDHGKTTLTDSLLNKAGIISDKDTGLKCATDIGKQEQERGITINSTGVSLHYTIADRNLPNDANGNEFLINLIDSPGHVDFNCEVTAALRVTDGALVVVDAVEGACVQTETVLRQALLERIKPVLMINKLDRYLFEKKYEAVDCYRQLVNVINQINLIISTYQNDKIQGDLQFYPDIGNVAFGSGYYVWGFTLNTVADFWIKRLDKPGQSKEEIQKRKQKLVTQMWASEEAFVKYVMGPIVNLTQLVDKNDFVNVFKFCDNIGVKLTNEDKGLREKKLVNCILRKWYPACDALLEMIVGKLPSPDVAQQYRTEFLYNGPTDDFVAESMRNCDPKGPVMVYISKLVPNKEKTKFYAFGRVFSGTLRMGQKVNFYGPGYEYGVPAPKDYFQNISVTSIYVMMANKMEPIEECPAGNTVCLAGMDNYILKNGTLSDVAHGHPFHAMKFSVSPVVRVAVSVKNASDLPKFIKALERLSKSDPLCKVIQEESGELIVAGAGELHIDVIMNNLRDEYCKGIEFQVSEPVVPFRESIQISGPVCLAKSPNSHNRLFIKAEPLNPELVHAIEEGVFDYNLDPVAACKELVTTYGWNPNEAQPKKIWKFGPEGVNTNVVVDCTTGTQYMNEIKDSVVAGFFMATTAGILCDEPMRGVKFMIMDCTLHADNIHRGGGQMIPCARRAMLAAQYLSEPCLTEPIFALDITVPDVAVSACYNVVSQRRGQITEQVNVEGTPMYKMKGTLPVMESFGFDQTLRSETSGQAFQQCTFSHWDTMAGSFQDPASRLMVTVKNVRTRKHSKDQNYSQDMPPLDRFLDKL
jgi:elongation factor 2